MVGADGHRWQAPVAHCEPESALLPPEWCSGSIQLSLTDTARFPPDSLPSHPLHPFAATGGATARSWSRTGASSQGSQVYNAFNFVHSFRKIVIMQLQPLQGDDRGCVVDFPLFYPLVSHLLPTHHMHPNILVFLGQAVNAFCRRCISFSHQDR